VPSVTWVAGLDAASADRVDEIISAATGVDQTAPVSEQVVLSLRENAVARHAVITVDARIVAYANLVDGTDEHPAMAEVVVDPQYRREGIGTDLVSSALSEGGAEARVWAHGNLPGARAVAERQGLVVARELLQMRRALAEPLPEIVVAEGISIRTYHGPDDDAELLRVNNAAFDWHPEQGGWTAADVSARREAGWFDPNGLFIAVDADGRMVGFHWTKVHTETADPIGEVYVVAIDPAAQGMGLGRALTLAGLHYLQDRSLADVLLYTEADNTAAVHTYRRLGFETFHVDVAYGRSAP
jgi:mycothiol synthase